MTTKAEKTKQFILEKVAPIFNKNGYVGTSLSDITKATGLTKGAIYGNYKNKEALALDAFNFNVRFVLNRIKEIIEEIDSPIEKLLAISDFHKTDIERELNAGGCPILNVGVDTKYSNPELFARVKIVVLRIQLSISSIIKEGQAKGEIKKEIDADAYGAKIFSMIEGAIFSTMLLEDKQHLLDMMTHLDQLILTKLKK